MAHLTSTNPGLWQKVLHWKKGWLWGYICIHSKMVYHPENFFLGRSEWLEIPSDGCKNCFPEWRSKGERFYVPARKICCEGPRTQSMQTYKILIWPQESTVSLVREVNWASSENQLKKLWSWWCNFVCQESWKFRVYLVVYVHDLLMIGNNESYIASIKKELRKGFEVTNLGYVHYYLGIEVIQHLKFIFLSQKKYIGDLLNRLSWLSAILWLLQWNRT